MVILSKRSRLFLIAVLTLAIFSSSNLDAMKPDRELSFGVIGQTCSHLAHNLQPNGGFVHKDIAAYIFLLHKKSLLVDDIVQNCVKPIGALWPLDFVEAIERVCKACGSDLSAQILSIALLQAGKLLCDIKNECGTTALHMAVGLGHKEVVNIILAVIPTLEQAWKLICMRDSCDCTALYRAAFYRYTDIVKILLAVAPNHEQAWKLIDMPNKDGFSAFFVANDEIKQIMEQYRPSNQ